MLNTVRVSVKDKKGEIKDVILDRAVVLAYNEADAWQKFKQAWGIRNTNHDATFLEVRDLTEQERLMPPAGVIGPQEGVLHGVPSPAGIMPIRADNSFNRPVPDPTVAGMG